MPDDDAIASYQAYGLANGVISTTIRPPLKCFTRRFTSSRLSALNGRVRCLGQPHTRRVNRDARGIVVPPYFGQVKPLLKNIRTRR